MNRRDFIKTALAGLAALVLPKGKAEEAPPSMHVRFTESETAWRYIWPSAKSEIISVPGCAKLATYTGGWIEPAESSWSLCSADGKCIEARGRLEMHRTVSPLFVTDEMIADWEAMGWKPEGEDE